MWSRPRWSSGYHTRLWIRGSRVRSRPGSMGFSERKNPSEGKWSRGSRVVHLRHVKEPQAEIGAFEQNFSDFSRSTVCRKLCWWPKMLKSVVKPNNNNFCVNFNILSISFKIMMIQVAFNFGECLFTLIWGTALNIMNWPFPLTKLCFLQNWTFLSGTVHYKLNILYAAPDLIS